jgi:uncharacterized protein (DUF488 family)
VSRELATIGFGKKGAERFVQLLRDVGVATVIDTRRRPDSPLAGYARQRDLPFLLSSAAAIGYEHRPELAPPDDLLERYRKDKDWPAYVLEFEERVLASPHAGETMMELLNRSSSEVVALLCSEPTPEQCHRRLVAERMKDMEPSLHVIHLV